MNVLDTNVGAEALRHQPSPQVMGWLSRQDEYDLHLTAIAQAELLFGMAVLPAGKHRRANEQALEALLEDVFADRVSPFDSRAARSYAVLVASARSRGSSITPADGQIGAIAATHGLPVATRDTSPFVAMGLTVIDPWQHQA